MVGVIRNPASVSCNVYKPATHVYMYVKVISYKDNTYVWHSVNLNLTHH